MAQTFNSIIIQRPLAEVFRKTNALEEWPKVFDEYARVEILSHEGNQVAFRLTANDGTSWESNRMIDQDHWIALASRKTPLFPFQFMHLRWIYRAVEGGTEMVWEQFFHMDPESGISDEKACENISAHSRINQANFKRWIEADNDPERHPPRQVS